MFTFDKVNFIKNLNFIFPLAAQGIMSRYMNWNNTELHLRKNKQDWKLILH